MKIKTKTNITFYLSYGCTISASTTRTCEADRHGVMQLLFAVSLWNKLQKTLLLFVSLSSVLSKQ